MNILHVNVRYMEGGAATIARSLHQAAGKFGHESKFVFGYGRRLSRKVAQAHSNNVVAIGGFCQVLSNFVLHSMVGVEMLVPPREMRAEFSRLVDWADVVHLHAIHSYFLPIDYLVETISDRGKPVIWTAHDYWPITGRCAFTEGCEGWRDGCGVCPSTSNYPSARIDVSSSIFRSRRESINRLRRNLKFVAPSEFVAAAFRDAYPDIETLVHPNWVDAELEVAIYQSMNSCSERSRNNFVIIAADLSDKTKIDHVLINSLLSNSTVTLHTVGVNSPFQGRNVVNHGKLNGREDMANILRKVEGLIFTSKKDTFGLVMIEALSCGAQVYAVPSDASGEVLGSLGLEPCLRSDRPYDDIIAFRTKNSLNPQDLMSRTRELYGSEKGAARYFGLYESLLHMS